MPRSFRKVFSLSLSCVIAKAEGPGRTGLRAAMKAAVGAGTFSNS